MKNKKRNKRKEDHRLIVFPAPSKGLERITCFSPRMEAVCPLTGHSDFYKVKIDYSPYKQCLETKSLQAYLSSFRKVTVVCERLAAVIARDILAAVDPSWVLVTLTRDANDGIVLEVSCRLPSQ